MSYTAVVHSFSKQLNPLCRSYEVDRLLHRCFRSDILPDRADHPEFKRAQVFGDLYLSNRDWKDRVEMPDASDAHEEHIDRLFWDKTFSRTPICILGVVGSGKSTLIDYYLRCYCPAKENRRADFEKKLVLHFDARTIQDNTDFYHRFFLFLQTEMRTKCRARGFDIDHAIGRRPSPPQNVRQWVHAALEELTRLPAKSSEHVCPFAYVVLVVDNLDQCSFDVQVRAITEVEQWLVTPSIRLYRAFLPMWPSTFRKLQNHQFNLLRGARSFEIGPINPDVLLDNRQRATREHLEKTKTPGTETAILYVEQMTRLGTDRLLRQIKSLAHANLRQMLSLWESLLCGDAAYGIWRQHQANLQSRRTFDYELLDALIVGTNDAFDHEEHRIANLFAMGTGRVRPRDLLIGQHAVELLGQGRHTQEDLYQSLDSLGYSEANIRVTEKSLMTFNFLHQEPAPERGIDYEIHADVVQEYLALRFEPAYVDNVALVTPVDPKYHARMVKTRGDRADDFMRRVSTTLAFLEFIRECEDEFRDPNHVTRTTAGTFIKALESLNLICLWKRMALRYKDRLVGLRNSGYLRTIDPAWWESVIAHPSLVEARDAADYLEPRSSG